ncbi:MAG: ROK family protein [Clostridia bacterium]|nr:ROK family protein [Clostridia bacterium]
MKIITFDIGGTFIKYALCDESFNLSQSTKIPTDAKQGGRKLIDKVIEIVKEHKDIDRVAISTAGQVDSTTGTIVYATDTIPGYTGTKIKEMVESATSIPTYVENDVNSAALGEAYFGKAKGYNDFICLTYGTGIGGAIWLNGDLYKGSLCSAGELGHIITHSGGKKCTCGGNGCYECYASARALVESVNENSDEILDGVKIFEEKNFNNPVIRTKVDEWIDEIVTGLMSIVYTFNPSLIVLGGGIMNENYIVDSINERINKKLMQSFRNVKIVNSNLGNTAGMLGVAYKASKI